MSIVAESEFGWLLDHLAHVNSAAESTAEADSPASGLRFDAEYFHQPRPHIAAAASAETAACGERQVEDGGDGTIALLGSTVKRKRKRKRNDMNQGEIDALAYHQTIRDFVLEGSRNLIDLGPAPASRAGCRDACCRACRDVAVDAEPDPLAELCDADAADAVGRGSLPERASDVLVLEDAGAGTTELTAKTVVGRVVENRRRGPSVVDFNGHEYVLPPRCSFLLSDVARLEPLLQYGTFDLIVLDPPWENKSVKRSKRYRALPEWQIARLPVPALASPGCLVLTWVTNRQRLLQFVKRELYPSWRVSDAVEWHWVKVTSHGEFVFPLDSPHKKPYETLVLGRVAATPDVERLPELPTRKLLVSVPSILHSQKPPLLNVLRPFLAPSARRLELFARNLHPGCTSWGNQVLKYQHLRHYTHASPSRK
ncbi:unnamed protein product [Lampetra planeri]